MKHTPVEIKPIQYFRKKPVTITAYQTHVELYIETLEGTMRADAGDWIITGVNGEKYPCKPDIFEKTYEPVDTTGQPISDIIATGKGE